MKVLIKIAQSNTEGSGKDYIIFGSGKKQLYKRRALDTGCGTVQKGKMAMSGRPSRQNGGKKMGKIGQKQKTELKKTS